MTFSEFSLYIMLIFLPGIIAYKTFEQLTHREDRKTYDVIIYIFLFGCLSYFFYYILCKIFGYSFTFHFLESLNSPKSVNFEEIIYVSCLAAILGLIITAFDTFKLLNRFAIRIKITKEHGEPDTFTFLMNSNVGKDAWVILRDVEDNRMYYGWIAAHSIGKEKGEIFLRDVIVFENSTGTRIMTSPGIYLAKPKEKYVIEFPELAYSDRMEKNILEEVEKKWETIDEEPSQ